MGLCYKYVVRIEQVTYDHPDAVKLIAEVQQEYVERYGGEIKRMYVTTRSRHHGYARLILAALESTARAAGHERVVLEIGAKQPEAVALYRSTGYTDIEPFGYYACAPLSIHLGKSLR